MIRNVSRLVRKTKEKKPHVQKNHDDSKPQDTLHKNYYQNVETFRSVYNNCSDVMFRPFLLFGKTKATIIYIKGLTNIEGIEEFVLSPLMNEPNNVPSSINEFLENKMPVSTVIRVNMLADCIESISSGNPILLIEGESAGFSLGLAKWEKRGIEEPIAEGGIRGSREGFNESLEINTSQLRRIIKSPALKIQSMKIGNYTKTTVAVAYIDGLVDQTLIEEITNRLKKIEIDGILESGYIEEMIEDNPYSPFPQIMSTERPDIACANLLEGRAVIIVEGTPFTLIAPISFFSLIQSHEDYYQRFMVGTFIRWLRFVFLGISLLLPSLYVAILTFHHEAVPTSLLLSISASREAVPFPAIVEALIMEITFEALREAGVRLPKQIGSAVSIVGALVIGQASVQAGLVSAPMVIVVAITGIASFMMPRYVAGIALRMLRFPMILLAGTLGLLGIMMGVIAIVIHLCSLRSFGIPYLSPLAPLKGRELKDVLWRAPWWMMDTRPRLTGESNLYRQAPEQAPNPKRGSETE
ncbi:spore germination protein [Peribacillus huizhouensis]|uniref:Spore germination protein KA n=1 Tax=Peribacillus huizhouensis TaxID=1501239 RepID=A0ABR6CT39_9BACI|nr:spore germination protein [Peribacillus huizhouensis]MBA9028201.1 spore germination protein KA [Peribacillus huizhouensis]